jgi:DNA-binding MarR family transcriptional regulator
MTHIYQTSGLYTATLRVSDGELTAFDTCKITVNDGLKQDDEKPTDQNDTTDDDVIDDTSKDTENTDSSSQEAKGNIFKSSYGIVVISSIVISIICISTFLAITEVGKFGFFSALGPFYSKQRKKKGDEYINNRSSVQSFINENPGERYNDIKRILHLPNGTLTYYLNALEREGLIKSERDGVFKRFYPSKGITVKESIELTEIQKAIFNIIKINPGVTQKNIMSALGISQQNLNYHIQLMVKARVIKLERVGNKTKCYIIEEVS